MQRTQIIRPGDTGKALCGGMIYMKKSKQLHAGTVQAYDAQTDKYSVLFQNGTTVEWDLKQVCKMWGKGKDRQQWSQVDQEALGGMVLRVQGHIVSNTSHTLCTLFPTLLSSSVWTETQTWYTCSVRWSLSLDIQSMLSTMGKAQDAKIAETIVQQKTVFWVPRDTWAEWATSSSSNRFGWIVQVVGKRSDGNGTTVLMIRSLHCNEFHRHGDINVTSPGKEISLRRIAALKREALMMSLSGAELGKLSEVGFRPCQALQRYEKVGSSSRVNQIVPLPPDPITREPRTILDIADPVQFQEDFRALRVTDSTWPDQDSTVQVTVRGGQAHQPSSIDRNKTAQWRQERILKTAGARRRKPQGTKPIEEPRWELLKHWHSSSEVIANWNQQWIKTDEWGEKGGCTLHWSITSSF